MVKMLDTIILGGTVADGTLAQPRRADVGIRAGKIVSVGDLSRESAAKIISAEGKLVTPGFIDIHRHCDIAYFRPDFGKAELKQGLTTIIGGQCGLSAAPCRGPYAQELIHYMNAVNGDVPAGTPLDSMKNYIDGLAERAFPIHVGTEVGMGTLRANVAGFLTENLSREEVRAIQALLEESLAAGALAVSLGMGYAPECFYTTEQLLDVLSPLRGTSTLVTCHMRQEGSEVEKSVAEMIELSMKLSIPVQISHLKAIGRENWGKKVPLVISMIEEARKSGADVGFDVYPYTAGSTLLLHVLPPEFLKGGVAQLPKTLMDPALRPLIRQRMETGTDFENISLLVGWENIIMASLNCPHNKPWAGMTIADIAKGQGKDPFDTLFDMLAEEKGEITMIDHVASEEDIALLLKHEAGLIISDSIYPTSGLRHPRLCGTFVRVLERYVKERKVLSLPEAIHKMTLAPARRFGIAGKGCIKEGYDADINIFDPDALHETGTYREPDQYAEGMDTVLVMGETAIEKGEFSHMTAGRLIRR